MITTLSAQSIIDSLVQDVYADFIDAQLSAQYGEGRWPEAPTYADVISLADSLPADQQALIADDLDGLISSEEIDYSK